MVNGLGATGSGFDEYAAGQDTGAVISKTAAEWTAGNTVLPSNWIGIETDTGRAKYGDGSTAWNSLPYRDLAGARFEDVASLLADTYLTYSTVSEGADIFAGQHAYKVAASGATDHHLTTAGGVKLYVEPSELGYNVKAFGAVGNFVPGMADPVDDTGAIQLAILASYNKSSVFQGWRGNTVPIYFPPSVGDYRIAQPGVLFSGCSGAAFEIHGAGDGNANRQGQSVLHFDPPTNSISNIMFDNNNLFGFTHFQNIGFTSNNGGLCFRHNNSVGSFAQSITYQNCTFGDFEDLFHFDGTTHTSECTWIKCKFRSFTGYGFVYSNAQGVNHNFFGCDAESFVGGYLFRFNVGVNVKWDGGSLIPGSGSPGGIAHVPATATVSTFGGGAQPHLTITNCGIEIFENNFVLKESPNSDFVMIVEKSKGGSGGVPTPASSNPNIIWAGAGSLIMRDVANIFAYRAALATDTSSAGQKFRMILDNCQDFPHAFLTESTVTNTGSAANTNRLPEIRATNCNAEVDGHYVLGAGATPAQVGVAQERYHPYTTTGNFIGFIASGSNVTYTVNCPPVVLQEVVIHLRRSTATAHDITVRVLKLDGTLIHPTSTITFSGTPHAQTVRMPIGQKIPETSCGFKVEFTSTLPGTTTLLGSWSAVY